MLGPALGSEIAQHPERLPPRVATEHRDPRRRTVTYVGYKVEAVARWLLSTPLAPDVTPSPKASAKPAPDVCPSLPLARIPTALALENPVQVDKRKYADMSDKQVKVLINALRGSSHPQAQALGERLKLGDMRGYKAPHFVRHTHADGSKRAYVVSRTWARGTFGKFRHVLELGDVPRHLAAKDFRASSRFLLDLAKIHRRAIGTKLDESELTQLFYNPDVVADFEKKQTLTPTQARDIDENIFYTEALVKDGTLTAAQGYAVLFNEPYVGRLLGAGRLGASEKRGLHLTRFVEPPAVANEYELVMRSQSPLAAIDRVAVDGHILMISKVMDGDLVLAERVTREQVCRLSRHLLARVGHHMAQAHAKGVVHRDLKPSNILFELASQDMVPSDFGLGAPLVEGHASGRVGTPGYAAPELLDEAQYTEAVDVFSLGMVIATMALRADLLPGRGRAMLKAMDDFKRVRAACPKRADGMCDLSGIDVHAESPNERALRLNLHDWYVHDPELATYAFTKLLAVDPGERDSMAQVAARFAPDPKSVTASLTKLVPRDRVAGELAIMEAFSAAYLLEDVPRTPRG